MAEKLRALCAKIMDGSEARAISRVYDLEAILSPRRSMVRGVASLAGNYTTGRESAFFAIRFLHMADDLSKKLTSS